MLWNSFLEVWQMNVEQLTFAVVRRELPKVCQLPSAAINARQLCCLSPGTEWMEKEMEQLSTFCLRGISATFFFFPPKKMHLHALRGRQLSS